MKEVSAGGVVYYDYNKDNIQLLMIQDKCQKWTLPKGKIEDNETFDETAIREIKEETGIDGEIVKSLDKVYYEYYHPVHSKIEKEVYFYLVRAFTKNIKVQFTEINSAEWFSLDEAWEKQKSSGYDNNYDVMKMALQELGYHSFN